MSKNVRCFCLHMIYSLSGIQLISVLNYVYQTKPGRIPIISIAVPSISTALESHALDCHAIYNLDRKLTEPLILTSEQWRARYPVNASILNWHQPQFSKLIV